MSFVTISRNKSFVQAVLAQDAADIAAQEAEIARRVRQEISKLREKTEAEARAAGEAAARAAMAPQEEALAQAAAALAEASVQLAAPLAQKERELAVLVTECAFLLAGHIAGGGESHAARLQALVTRLLEEAAGERGPRQLLRLRFNPADQDIIAAHLPAEAAQLVADEKIAAGGAMLELITPDGDPVDRVEWDATLHGRLQNIGAALGIGGDAP